MLTRHAEPPYTRHANGHIQPDKVSLSLLVKKKNKINKIKKKERKKKNERKKRKKGKSRKKRNERKLVS
jgi:hypothetical protein